MRQEKKIVPKYKSIRVEDGIEEIITYVSDDGLKKSYNQSDILKYEAQKPFEQIECKSVLSNFIDYELWFRLKNEEEKTIFINHYGFNADNKYIEDLYFNYDPIDYWDLELLPINKWFTIKYSDGGDHRSSYYIFTLDYIKSDVKLFLDSLIDTGV